MVIYKAALAVTGKLQRTRTYIQNQQALPTQLVKAFDIAADGQLHIVPFLRARQNVPIQMRADLDLLQDEFTVFGLTEGTGGDCPVSAHLIFTHELAEAIERLAQLVQHIGADAAGRKRIAAQRDRFGDILQQRQIPALQRQLRDLQTYLATADVDHSKQRCFV